MHTHPLEYGRSYVLSKELFGNNIGGDAIPNLVRRLDVRNALSSLSKVIWGLENLGALNRDAQHHISKQFLSDTIFPKAIQLLQDPSRAIFFRGQAHTLFKLVALHSQFRDPPQPVTPNDLVTLGTALMGATDLLARESIRIRRAVKSKDKLSSIVLRMSLGELMMKSRRPLFDVIRTREMYVEGHKKARIEQLPSYVDFESQFEAVTGIEIDTFINVGLLFILHLMQFRNPSEFVPSKRDFNLLMPKSIFGGSLLTDDTIEKVFNIVSIDLDQLRTIVEAQNNRDLGFNNLALQSRPLLRVNGDTYLPISFDFIIEKFTTGIYWTLFDILSKARNDLHLRFSEYNGVLFERYVADLVRPVAAREGTKDRPFIADVVYYKGKLQFRTSDAIIIGDDYLIIIEATAGRITAKRTLADGLQEAFIDDCEKVIWKKAKELNRFIEDIVEGEVVIAGYQLNRKPKMYPVIVTIDGFPKIPVIDDFIMKHIEEKDWLAQEGVQPLSILPIDSLEDVARERNLTFKEAITSWQEDSRFPYESLSQFLYRSDGFITDDESEWFESAMSSNLDNAFQLIYGKTYEEVQKLAAMDDDTKNHTSAGV